MLKWVTAATAAVWRKKRLLMTDKKGEKIMISTDSETKMAQSMCRGWRSAHSMETDIFASWILLSASEDSSRAADTSPSLFLPTGAHLRMLRTKLNVINHRKGWQESGTWSSAECRRRTHFLHTVMLKWCSTDWCHYLLGQMLTRGLPLHPNARLAIGKKVTTQL